MTYTGYLIGTLIPLVTTPTSMLGTCTSHSTQPASEGVAMAASLLHSTFVQSSILSAASSSPTTLLSTTFFSPSLHYVAPRPRQRLLVRAARIQSAPIPLASRAPYFELPEPLTGKVWKLDDFEVYCGLLVMFISNHCPFVAYLKPHMAKLADEYIQKGIGVVAISANSVKTHPQDGPEFMAEEAKGLGYPFPYLYDETQEVAKAFGAVCTPDFFLFKKDGRRPFELVYHGQFDDSRPNTNRPITGRDIREAMDCILSGRPVNKVQRPSMGCSIKWHPE